MSANFATIRLRGDIKRIPKSAFETDDKLYVRAWYCATSDTIDDVVISNSHKHANEKYFNMKYIDKPDGRS